MKEITREQYNKLLEYNCNKEKHRFRNNKYGVTWCVICGKLGYGPTCSIELKEEDKIKVI